MDTAWRIVFDTLSVRDRIRLESVCKRWQLLLAHNWMSIRKISSQEYCTGFPVKKWPYILVEIMRRCSNELTHFSYGLPSGIEWEVPISEMPLLNAELMIALIQKTYMLRVFCVNLSVIHQDAIFWVRKLPHSLKMFCLDTCDVHFYNSKELKYAFREMLGRCTSLEQFSITHHPFDTFSMACTDIIEKIPPSVKILTLPDHVRMCEVEFENLKNLRALEVRDLNISRPDPLEHLIRCATNIVFLDISGVHRLRNYYAFNMLMGLRFLVINSTCIDSALMLEMLPIARKLEGFSMNNCERVKTNALKLIQQFRKLRYLSVSNTSLNDETLEAITNCPMIEWLDVSNCDELTEFGLRHLVKLKKLKYLCTTNVIDFTPEIQTSLLAINPELKICAENTFATMSDVERHLLIQRDHITVVTRPRLLNLHKYDRIGLITRERCGVKTEHW